MRMATPALHSLFDRGDSFVAAEVLNLSASGLLARASEPLRLGDRLAWVPLAAGDTGLPLDFTVQVVRVVPGPRPEAPLEVACCFVDPPDAALGALKAYLARE